MTDKPQTLAEQIAALHRYKLVHDTQYQSQMLRRHDGGWVKYSDAAALADASTTTTPVVVAEQAGDVRQAVRVKLFIDDDGDICHEPRGAAMNLVALPAVDDGGRVMHPDLFQAMVDAYNSGPTPALSWRVMQTAAADWHTRTAQNCGLDGDLVCENEHYRSRRAILALPSPSDAQALAEAVRLVNRQPADNALAASVMREKAAQAAFNYCVSSVVTVALDDAIRAIPIDRAEVVRAAFALPEVAAVVNAARNLMAALEGDSQGYLDAARDEMDDALSAAKGHSNG